MSSIDKIKDLLKDKAFVEGLLKNKSPEEAKAYLAEHGVEMTMDEVKSLGGALGAAMKSDGELSDAELAAVAGGGDAEVIIEICEAIGKGASKAWDWVTGLGW